MNVSLTPELEKLVQSKVKSGLYNSASEVIREGLRLLKEHDLLIEVSNDELKAQIKKGIESGYSSPVNKDFFDEIKQRGRARLTS